MTDFRHLFLVLAATLATHAAFAGEPYPDESAAFGIPPGSLLIFGRPSLLRDRETYSRANYLDGIPQCHVIFKENSEQTAFKDNAIKVVNTTTRGEWVILGLQHPTLKAIECRKEVFRIKYQVLNYLRYPLHHFAAVDQIKSGDVRAAFNWDFWIALPEKAAAEAQP